jgi:hypothetical protein
VVGGITKYQREADGIMKIVFAFLIIGLSSCVSVKQESNVDSKVGDSYVIQDAQLIGGRVKTTTYVKRVTRLSY